MKKRSITSDKAPAAIGPYSQAVECGRFLFVSGQLGIDPASGALRSGVEEQAKQALQNLGAILAVRGLGFGAVVKTTIFLADMKDFALVNEIYANHFTTDFPARSTVQVAGLPKGGLVEIEAIAQVED